MPLPHRAGKEVALVNSRREQVTTRQSDMWRLRTAWMMPPGSWQIVAYVALVNLPVGVSCTLVTLMS